MYVKGVKSSSKWSYTSLFITFLMCTYCGSGFILLICVELHKQNRYRDMEIKEYVKGVERSSKWSYTYLLITFLMCTYWGSGFILLLCVELHKQNRYRDTEIKGYVKGVERSSKWSYTSLLITFLMCTYCGSGFILLICVELHKQNRYRDTEIKGYVKGVERSSKWSYTSLLITFLIFN